MLKKNILSLCTIALAIAVLSMITTVFGMGCNHSTDTAKTEHPITFTSTTLGVALDFPGDWEDKYVVDESEDSLYVFCKDAGLLFTLVRVPGELVTPEDMQQAPVRQQMVLQGNGYTYFTRFPSDIQYPLDDQEIRSKYLSMSEQLVNIPDWISLLKSEIPPAANEGFKVMGSSFFTVEIPDKWDMKLENGSAITWSLFTEGNQVGVLELIPYLSENPLENNMTDDDMLVEYIANHELLREFRIALSSEYADIVLMEKIKNSLVFLDGPYNVVDLHSHASQYMAGGGKKVFGRIEDIEVENGKPVAVRVKVMRWGTESSENETQNGFVIDDLNQVESYSLDSGVKVAPLAAPNYTSYGIYDMPRLDEDFLKDYGNFQDFYYDFILGSDGQLKLIIGHYVA